MSDLIELFGKKIGKLGPESTLEEDAKAIRDGKAHIHLFPIQVVQVTGSDSADYLNRRCSQKIIDMKTGDVRRSMILDGVGKIEHDFDIICRQENQEFLLVTIPGRGDSLAADLEKYIFTEDCTAVIPGNFPEAASGRTGILDLSNTAWEMVTEQNFVYQSDLFGGQLLVPLDSYQIDGGTVKNPENLKEIGAQAWLDHAVEIGQLIYGMDYSDIIPLEANLHRAMHFDKGCYPGQETIATITNLGHPSRQFVSLKCLGKLPEGFSGELFTKENQKAGYLTRCNGAGDLALGWVKWLQKEPGTVLKTESGEEIQVIDVVNT